MRCFRFIRAQALRDWVCRHGLFVAALWVLLAYIGLQLGPLLGVLVAACALILGFALGLHRAALGWLFCIVLAVGIAQWRSHADRQHALTLSWSATSKFAGKLLAEPRGNENFWQAPVRLESGAKVWWQGRGGLPVEGSGVASTGRFETPDAPRNPGEFDRQRWMKQQGLVAIFRQQPHADLELQTPAWARMLADARAGLRTAVTRGLDEDSTGLKVIRAVVLGEKPRDDRELLDDFRLSGSMHVFSVSGLHVGMLAALVWLLASMTGLSRRWLALPVIAVVFAYAWLTGANPPAVRAAWMAAVFLAAFCLRRRPDLANSMGAVLLVLLIWDVRQIEQPGVQLSYGVVTAIAFGLPWTSRWFSRIGASPLHMPASQIRGFARLSLRLRQWVATTMAVSCAAGLGAAPLTAWHFGLVTPVSVIAALLMLPMVFAVMALALFSALLSPLPDAVGASVNRINGGLANACARIASVMADIPGGHWRTARERGPQLWIYDLKYGDGAACWLPQRDAAAVLIDCGGRHSFLNPLCSSMERMGLRPDSVVLTHPDGGHLGGGHPVWSDLPIRQALIPVTRARSPAYRQWLEQAPAAGVDLIQASTRNGLPLGEDAYLEWLHLPDADALNLAADDRVLVMRMHWQGWRILYLGDAGLSAEQAMLESGLDLTADVLIAGSHRSDLSLSDRFVEAVQPRVLIMDGEGQLHGSYPFPVFDQSRCGAVSVRPESGHLIIEGYVNAQRLKLTPSS